MEALESDDGHATHEEDRADQAHEQERVSGDGAQRDGHSGCDEEQGDQEREAERAQFPFDHGEVTGCEGAHDDTGGESAEHHVQVQDR